MSVEQAKFLTRKKLLSRMFELVRLLLGLQYVIIGVNWWYKILPFPSQVDLPLAFYKHDILRPMIESGWMFDATKLIELLAGIALLFNRWIPLAMVVAMPIALMTFTLDAVPFGLLLANPDAVTLPQFRAAMLDMVYFGGAVLVMQGFLMACLLRNYLPMLAMRSSPDLAELAPAADASGAATSFSLQASRLFAG
jgi:hypothetical protein